MRNLLVIIIAILLTGCITKPSINETKSEPWYEKCGGSWANVIDGSDWDSDQDGMSNEEEWHRGTDRCFPDTDHDQWNDFEEVYRYFTDPLKNDTDNDGLIDSKDPLPKNDMGDYDGDGLLDQFDFDPWMDAQYTISIEWTINFTNGNEYYWSFDIDDIDIEDIYINDGENQTQEIIFDYDWPDEKFSLEANLTVNSVTYLKIMDGWSLQYYHEDDDGTLGYTVRYVKSEV